MGDVTFLDGLNNLTLCSRVKIDSPNANRTMVLSKDNAYELFFDNSGNQICLRLNNGNYNGVNFEFLTDRFYYLTAVLDSDTIKYYVDGELISTVAATVSPLNNTSSVLTIGVRRNYHSLNGNIDDVTIWNRALTQEEIQSSISVLSGDEDNLVGYWKQRMG